MGTTYITSAGDMWDSIALKLYGNVSYTEFLMNSNQDATLLATVIFAAGVTISTPPLPIITTINPGMPPWRTS
jgi:phage tail protein X